jgi:hypothetical protein
MHVHLHDARAMSRSLSIILLLAAIVDASEASAMIFSLLPAQGAASQTGAAPNLLPQSAAQSAQSSMPVVETSHVPVYQTYALPPPKPPKPSSIYVPDSQNTSRRRHLGW